MNLNDEFEVPLAIAEAWAVLTDIEKITPYLPGIWLLEVEGDKYQGVVKIRVGPVTVWYKGIARYLSLDAEARRAVLKAEGGEIHGPGTGTALVTATLSPTARGTRVHVVTVLSVDGKLAQLTHDALAAMSRNLIAEFAENLEFTVLAAPKTPYPSTGESQDEPAGLFSPPTRHLTVGGLCRRAMVHVRRPFETSAARAKRPTPR